MQTRIKPLSNDPVRHIRFQNTQTAGGVGIEPAQRKYVIVEYLLLKWDIDAANVVTKAQALEPRGEGIKVDCQV
jgi:hypothetical protein